MLRKPYVAHFDGDSFFVSCELLRRPDLRGKPVVTGGERGVVTSMSKEARILGVRRTTPCFEIRRDFPSVIILESSIDLYTAHARRVYSIVRDYAVSVEEYSIDECFALIADPAIALQAKKELESSTGLTFGVGVSLNKTLAKVASRFSKPAGFKELIDTTEIKSALNELPIEGVWGIGRATSAALRARGIGTASDLAAAPQLDARFSEPVRRTARELAGRFELPIIENAPTRFFEGYSEQESEQASVCSSRTFHPPETTIDTLRARAVEHLDSACARVRSMNKAARRITVLLRDKEYRVVSEDARIEPPSSSPAGCLVGLRRALSEVLQPGTSYRTVGVTLHDFVDRGLVQNDLFSETTASSVSAKQDAVADAVDAIRHRLGEGAIRFGAAVASEALSSQGGVPRVRQKCVPVRPWAYPYLGEVK